MLIKMCNVNVNGLCTKLGLLANFVSQFKVDVVGITETHLVSHIASSFISIPNYSLFRCDTVGSFPKHGVAAYVHNDIQVDQVSTPYKNVLTFRMTRFNIFVLIVYRPPSYTIIENEELLQSLQTFVSDKEAILIGDFNLPNVIWGEDDAHHIFHGTSTERAFLDMFDTLGLKQWISVPTYPSSGNTLDLVLTTEPDCIGSATVESPLPACDHCPIVFEYVLSTDTLPRDEHSSFGRLWHKGNFKKLNKLLLDVDWDYELALMNSDESYEKLLRTVKDIAHELIPVKQSRLPKVKPPWHTNPPGSLVRKHNRVWQTYKLVRQEQGRRSPAALEAYGHFSSLNRQVRCFSVQSQSRYEHSLIEKWKDNPKLLHAYIRSKKSAPVTVGPLQLKDGTISSDPQAMSECLAEAFCSVYTRGEPDNQVPHQVHDSSMPDMHLTVEEVRTLLENTDGNTAMGPDGLHPLILKNCAESLAKPIHTVFIRSLQEGQLPAAWKDSAVIPIFKKGHQIDLLNYRPVCLTSVVCKRLERKLSEHIYNYLQSSSLLSSHQFGFRPGYSTTEQLMLVYEEVSAGVDAGRTVDVVLFDYSKAFDVVPHAVLLKKLEHLGIEGDVLCWISSFLMGRTMRVSVKNHFSEAKEVTSGVPQGSVLGPLLFLIYINHVASQLSCKYKIFADDLKIYACGEAHNTGTDLEPRIQADIDALSSTSESWGLSLNPKKCVVLRFSRKKQETPCYVLQGSILPSPRAHTDLGVIIDTSLKFHDHISSITRKISGLGHSFLKSTVCRSREFMLFFLTVHLRPILEYASCVWHTGYTEDARSLERFQRYWTKQIDMLNHLTYGDRLRELDLYSVKGRLVRADLIHYWKIFHKQSCIAPEAMFPQPPTSNTRGHKYKIGMVHVNTDVRKRAFSKRCVKLWNSLPQYVVDAPSIASFKRGLDSVIPDVLFDFA